MTIYRLQKTGLPRSGKNIWKTNFFPGQGKVREFCGWPGKFRKDLESQGNSGNLKKKMAMASSLQKIYSVQEGKGCTFSEIVQAHLPSQWGLLLKERICSLGEQIHSFKSNPQI